MENSVLETLIVKITAPLEALKSDLRQASQATGQAGKDAADNFTKSFRPNASAQVVAEMREASAQGARAAGAAGRAAGDAYADGFRSQVNGVGQQVGSSLQAAFAAAVAVAGTGIIVGQMRDLAAQANSTQIAIEAWSRTLQRAKVDQEDAEKTVTRLAERFGVAKTQIYGAAEVLVRNKASLQQIEQLYSGVAASALKAGKPVSEAWEQVSIAVATGRSELVETYGLISNFGPAMDKYAKSIGKTADDLTDQERVTANINVLLKETQAELADVDLYLRGYTKAVSDNQSAQQQLRDEIGKALLPTVTAFTVASNNAMNGMLEWMRANREEVIPTVGKVAVALFDAGNGIYTFAQLAILNFKNIATAVGGIATVLVGIVATVTGTVGGIISAAIGGIREALTAASDIISKLKAAKDAALSGDFAGAGAQLSGARDRAAAGVNTIGKGYGQAINKGTTFGRAIITEGANDIGSLKNIQAEYTAVTNAALDRSQAFRNTVSKTTTEVLKFGAATGGVAKPLKEMNDATGKATDKSKKSAAEKEKERQATEAARIAFDKWKDSLKNATTAQLQAALARAEANNDYDKWKAISAELERREGVLTAATKKAAAERAAAAKREADERERAAERIRDAQASINEDNALKKLEASARNASDTRLKELLSAAYKDGDRNRYNLIAGILKDRADARTQADKDFAQALKEGEQAGLDALNEVLSDPANFATGIDRAGTAIPAAQSQFDSLFDTLFELRGELNTPGIADAFIDGLEETARQGNLTAKELQTLVDVVNDLSAPRQTLQTDNLQGRGIADGVMPSETDPATGFLADGEKQKIIAQMDGMNIEEIGAIYADLIFKGLENSDLGNLIANYLEDHTKLIDDALREYGGMTFDEDGNPVFQTDADARGSTTPGDGVDSPLDFSTLDVSLIGTIQELDDLVEKAGLGEEAAQTLREAWQAHNEALLSMIKGYDEAGNAIYYTDAELRELGATTGETSEDFFDLGEAVGNVGKFSRNELEKLIVTAKLTEEQAAALRAEWERLAKVKFDDQQKQMMDLAESIADGVSQVGALFDKISGSEGKGALSILGDWMQMNVKAGTQWMSGDYVGAIMTTLEGIMNIGESIAELNSGLREWKKNLREVAEEQKKVLGMSTGGFKSPWEDALKKDAGNREQLANSKWYQRLWWGLTGGGPQAISDEAAKLLTDLQEIFAQLGDGIADAFTDAMLSAFEAGDMSQFADNFSKQFDAVVGKVILKTMIEAALTQGAVADDLAALTKAIQEQRYGDVPPILASIKQKAGQIGAGIAAVAPSLPGYGSGADGGAGGPDTRALFGNAPTAQLGIPRFEVTLPDTVMKPLGDFAAVIPAFSRATDRLYEAADMIVRANGGLQRTTGLAPL